MTKGDDERPIAGDGRARPSDVDVRVGDRLRLRRKVLGMTQAELGERCAVSAQQIHKYEQGLSSMSAGRLAKFSAVLAVSVGWFFGEDDVGSGLPTELLNLLSDPYNIEAISLLTQVDDARAKKLAINLIKNVAKYASAESAGLGVDSATSKKINL